MQKFPVEKFPAEMGKPASPEGGDDAGPVTTETDCNYDRPEAQTGNVVAASQT